MTAGDTFSALNKAKRIIGQQLGAWDRRGISAEAQDAVAVVRGAQHEMKTALENPDVWGEVGATQARFNSAQETYLPAQGKAEKEFMAKVQGRGLRPTYTMDAKKLARLSDTANPNYLTLKDTWDNWINESKNMVDAISDSHANAPVGAFDRDALTGLINKSGEMEQAARQQGSILRILGRIGGVGPMGTIAGSLAGVPALGIAFDVVAKGAKLIPHAVDVLSRLHANNEAVTSAIDAAAARLGSAGSKAATAGRGEVLAGLARSFGMDAEEATAHFDKHANEIRRFASDPNHLQAALEEQAAGLHEHAPQTAQALATTSARAVQFLASKLPQTVRVGPLADPLPHSQHEIAVYTRYREAVEHPLSILSQAKAGTLTKEGIEAVQAVYPHLYRQIQAAVVEKLSPDLPYSARLMASMIMGRDLDGSATPQAIMRAQAIFTRPQPMPQMMPKRGGGRSGAAKITLHDRTLTSSQRVAEGEK